MRKLLICAILIFSMISSSCLAVYIQSKGDPTAYIDIEGHWATESIKYVISNGYFKGMTSKEFMPETDMSRAMLVTVLWRLTGDSLTTTRTINGVTKKVPKYVNMFWDMKDDEWYTNYVSWANANEIIDGYSKREFGPDDSVTREQLAVILYNYMKNYKLVRSFETLKTNNIVTFNDDSLISDWAKEKVSIIQQIGLMQGRTGGDFDPKGNVTRAEVAVIIERLLQIF